MTILGRMKSRSQRLAKLLTPLSTRSQRIPDGVKSLLVNCGLYVAVHARLTAQIDRNSRQTLDSSVDALKVRGNSPFGTNGPQSGE